jgi:hypothetical protein
MRCTVDNFTSAEYGTSMKDDMLMKRTYPGENVVEKSTYGRRKHELDRI